MIQMSRAHADKDLVNHKETFYRPFVPISADRNFTLSVNV